MAFWRPTHSSPTEPPGHAVSRPFGPSYPLTTNVFLIVLAAAALHAGWNTMVKAGRDRFLALAWVAIAAAPFALPLAFLFGWPGWEALPWLVASIVFHVGYQVFLAKAYVAGDLGQTYALARGAAPLLIALVGAAWFGEALPPEGWAGVLVLSAGIAAMALRGGANALPSFAAVIYALTTAGFIAAYTLSDGLGGRAGTSPHAYTAFLFLANAFVMAAIVLATRGAAGLTRPPGGAAVAVLGAAMSFAAYWAAIWAMTVSPIGLVASLRESSILFAAAFSVLFLGERASIWRGVSAGIILAGIVVLRLA